MKLSQILLVLSIVAVTSCKVNKSPSSTNQLKPADYKIVKIVGESVEHKNLNLEIIAKTNKISGYSGCNTYQFNYQFENGRFSLDQGISTKKYCEDDMKVENLFLKQTKKITKVKQTETEILFINDEGETLIKAQKQ